MLNSKLVYQHSPERVNKVLEIHTGNLFVEINDKSCVIHTTVYTTTFSIYLSIYLHHNIYYISLFSLFYIFLYLSCKICCMNCCTNNISLMILYSHFKLQAKAMKFHWQKEEQTRNSPGHKFWLLLIRFHKNPRFTNIMGISLIQNYFNSFRII